MTPRLLASVLALAALLALPAPGLAAEKVRGLDPLVTTRTWKLPHPSQGRALDQATRTCQVYPRHAVLWSDEGVMGAVDLEVRSRPKGMSPEQVCGDKFRGKSVRPREDAELTPKGIFDHFLLAAFPDGFGVLCSFTLVDLDTGKKAFGDEYAFDRELSLARGPGGPVLTYWANLKDFDCVPRAGETACWAHIRERYGIPATVPPPDCEPVISKAPAVLQGRPNETLQLTVHVRVERLSRRDTTWLPDRPSCDPTP